MSMDAELYSRVRKLEKQVEALMEKHPEVRAVLERETVALADRTPVVTWSDDVHPCSIEGRKRASDAP